MDKIIARDKSHLKDLIKEHTYSYGVLCDLNHIDISNLTDISYVFHRLAFSGDISKWDTSNIKNMKGLFKNSSFNSDISKWDVSKVTNMSSMFHFSYYFNKDISQWNTSNVQDMSSMFFNSQFNGDILKWDTSKVEDMEDIFCMSSFNGDVSCWNLCSLINHKNGFSKFNDSPLGYMSVLQGNMSFPEDDNRAARFNELRSLCDGLNMDVKSAAQYIYKELNNPAQNEKLNQFNEFGL